MTLLEKRQEVVDRNGTYLAFVAIPNERTRRRNTLSTVIKLCKSATSMTVISASALFTVGFTASSLLTYVIASVIVVFSFPTVVVESGQPGRGRSYQVCGFVMHSAGKGSECIHVHVSTLSFL